MKNISNLFILFCLGSFFTLACNNQKESQSADQILSGGSWTAITMYGDTLIKKDFLRGMPSIIFKDSTSFSGTTGCNQYSARYSKEGQNVKIEMGPMTKMACPGKSESLFVEALGATNKVRIENGIMKFYNTDSEVLTFRKAK